MADQEKPPYPTQQQAYPTQEQAYPPAQQQAYPPAQHQPYPTQEQQPAYPPQAVQPPPPQSAAQTNVTVVTTAPKAVGTHSFRDYPIKMTAPDGTEYFTKLQYRPSIITWIICVSICCVLFWCTIVLAPLGLVAFCINSTKNVYHLDPQGNVVGVYKRL